MTESWRTVADRLAARMVHHAWCDNHPASAPNLEDCPNCRDRAAYEAWEAKSGQTYREKPYDGPVLDILTDVSRRRRDGV